MHTTELLIGVFHKADNLFEVCNPSNIMNISPCPHLWSIHFATTLWFPPALKTDPQLALKNKSIMGCPKESNSWPPAVCYPCKINKVQNFQYRMVDGLKFIRITQREVRLLLADNYRLLRY